MKITRTVASDRVTSREGNLTIHVNETNHTVLIQVMGTDYKVQSITMTWEDFLDQVVACWPENVAYQFKDD